MLADTYFCNFSLFQSMPDSWAIRQLFPIMPIHRLNERPTRHAILGDISCDSDGKIDQFIDRRDVKRTLPLHPFNGEPYYLGAFLLGAYQEILGDLHNLFGDTNAVHVSLGENGEVILDNVIKGDTVREVLEYVQFNSEVLLSQFRRDVEAALREGRIGYEESGRLLRFLRRGIVRLHLPRRRQVALICCPRLSARGRRAAAADGRWTESGPAARGPGS
jgi:arginine decarboxylase